MAWDYESRQKTISLAEDPKQRALVAGLEYSTLALYLVNQGSNLTVEPILIGTPHHLFKGFPLFATGVVTSLLILQIKQRILESFEMVEERNRISRTFGEYVSPAVMDVGERSKLRDLLVKEVCSFSGAIPKGQAQVRGRKEAIQVYQSQEIC